MPKTRNSPRYRKRLKVTLGTATSFTVDVSAGGFCTEAMRVLPAGTAVKGSFFMDGKQVPFDGRVAWAKPGHPQMDIRGRMGVSFVHAPEHLRQIVEKH